MEKADTCAGQAGVSKDWCKILSTQQILRGGFGYIGIPLGVALVSSYIQIVARVREYNALGVELFFLAGYPHLEEIYRLGEHVLTHFVHERQALQPIEESQAALQAVG